MNYTKDEVLQYVREDDVKFIRLAFCDAFGRQKNISIMPDELPRAFSQGIAFDASAIRGFGDEAHSDLLLHPQPETLMQLPWRPEHGKVVRMFSRVRYPDGSAFEGDTRLLLQRAAEQAAAAGMHFSFGAEQEFYLFRLDENGDPTTIPYDRAGYMDLAPDDRGENIRREVCLTLERMGISPESSHHEMGPGQNEIDFRYSDALTAADNAMTFQTVVRTVAQQNGLAADFSAKPLKDQPGNGFHINISLSCDDGLDRMDKVIAGVLNRTAEMTVFLNPTEGSYRRLGVSKAPRYVSWSHQNRSQLVRVPYAVGDYRRVELRSPDPMANPYLAFALIIHAAMEAVEQDLPLPARADVNLYTADAETLSRFPLLPQTLQQARECAKNSAFIRRVLPQRLLEIYCGS